MVRNGDRTRPLLKERQDLEKNGYTLLPSVFSGVEMAIYLERLMAVLNVCAGELACKLEEYLRCLSRWVAPSPVLAVFDQFLLEKLEIQLRRVFEDCSLKKTNVISKTKYAAGVVPFHQDISYSPGDPYHVTAWLALTDVPVYAGPLTIIAGSHRGPIQPAVDFWDPEFFDLVKDSTPKRKCVAVPLKAGDVLLFDSRVWHGSEENKVGFNRFAFVTRWKIQAFTWPQKVPEIQKKPFGMWTCQAITQQVLQEALGHFVRESLPSFEKLLVRWADLCLSYDFPFVFEKIAARAALKNLYILHRGSLLHNGSDAHGVHYPALWRSLLAPLKSYQKQNPQERASA